MPEFREVRTQAELDRALADITFDDRGEPNLIPVLEGNGSFSISEGSPRLHVKGSSKPRMVAWGSSEPRMVAWGSSKPLMEARESSEPLMVAWESSEPLMVAWESSKPLMVAWGSSKPLMVARGSSKPRMEARGSSKPRMEAWESSEPRMVAWESSEPLMVARESSKPRMVARGSSKPLMEARGSSKPLMEAWESSKPLMVARESSKLTGEVGRWAGAIASQHGRAKVDVKGAVLLEVPVIDSPELWCEYHGVGVADGVATLYKAVDSNFRSGYGFAYDPGSTPQAPDWDGGERECGGGLHFSPTPAHAREFMPGADRYVSCPVALKDIAVHVDAAMPQKVKARGCAGPVAECDIHGDPVRAAA